ncbi:MAG: hypothetical protein ACOY4R_27715 [Pseudomonadota bacterium]
MSRRKNLFARIGRPPAVKPLTATRHPSTGEKQGAAPSDRLDMAMPGKAYRRGGPVRHHDDPRFNKR